MSGEVTTLIRTAAVKASPPREYFEDRSRNLDHGVRKLTALQHRSRRGCLIVAFGVCLLLAGCGPEPEPPATFHPSTPKEAAALAYFTGTVKPVFRQNCYRCHSGLNHKSNFNLSTRELLLKGGSNGVDVVPGHPENSLLVKLIRHAYPAEHPASMPPKGKLSDTEIAAVEKWIADGVIMDR